MNSKTFSVVTTVLALLSGFAHADGDRYGKSKAKPEAYTRIKLNPDQIASLDQAVTSNDRHDFSMNPKMRAYANDVFQYLKSGDISEADGLADRISHLIEVGDAATFNKTNQLIGEIATRLDEKEKGIALIQSLTQHWRENAFVIASMNQKKKFEKKTVTVAQTVSGGMVGATAGLFLVGIIAVFVPPAGAVLGTAALYGAGGGALLGGVSGAMSPETATFVSPVEASKKWFPSEYAQLKQDDLPVTLALAYRRLR